MTARTIEWLTPNPLSVTYLWNLANEHRTLNRRDEISDNN